MGPKRFREHSPVRPWYEDEGGEGYIDPGGARLQRERKEAGEAFVDELIEAYLRGKPMSARLMCVLCYWAGKAGMQEASKYGLSPNNTGGHFQRKIDVALNLEQYDEHLYELDIPGQQRSEPTRGSLQVHINPPHEVLAAEVAKHPEILEKWRGRVSDEAWIPAYEEHPIVVDSGPAERQNLLPIALYMDKTPYTNNDSFLGIFCHFVHTGRRHMVACLRTADLCHCGCSYWCSLFPIYVALHWSLKALVSGLMPDRRHDGAYWRDSDKQRQGKAELNSSTMWIQSSFQTCVVGFSRRPHRALSILLRSTSILTRSSPSSLCPSPPLSPPSESSLDASVPNSPDQSGGHPVRSGGLIGPHRPLIGSLAFHWLQLSL